MTLFVLSVSLALLISAICSLMEATLLSLIPSQVADLAHRQPKVGRIWQRFKANIQPPIALSCRWWRPGLPVRGHREIRSEANTNCQQSS